LLTASIGFDALAQAIESFVSTSHSPVTDLHALESVRLIAQNLPRVLMEPNNIDARTGQMLGALESGLAFSNASLGLLHAIAHSVGGFLGLSHGECAAMLLGPVIEFNFEAAAERYRLIGEAMGLDLRGTPVEAQSSVIIEEVDRIRQLGGVGHTLGQAGVRKCDIPQLAEKAMRDPCIVTNPRRPGQLDLEVLIEKAL
jgi:alcohol dehydrogenase class IV